MVASVIPAPVMFITVLDWLFKKGDWFAPNGTKVGNYTDSMPRDVPGFGRTRGPHVVRLKRSSHGTPPEGVYKCVVRDTTDINQTVYVGIYSRNGM